jgi:regulation of enolase protein 1 (concanavalin A-like superfamily)
MKTNTLPALALSVLMASCSPKKEDTAKAAETPVPPTAPEGFINGNPCNIAISGITFTKSVNGADSLAKADKNGKVTFKSGARKDYFNDPDGKLSNNTAPILLTEVDNTKPFTFTAKVTPGFTPKGLYNAGVLYIYVNDGLWQKHCFEQDERGKHRIVTVRTIGTSDDNNHDVVSQPWAYMKISSDGKTVASYYSADNKEWQMVRLYKNEYPQKIWMGISSQCPMDNGTVSYFEDISLTQESVTDFRTGQ